MTTFAHTPVMLKESIKAMNINPDGAYIDATYGYGGHSKEILNILGTSGHLYAIDKDIYAIKMANSQRNNDKRFTLKHGCFSELDKLSHDWGIHGSVNGILFDLGVSSHHLNEPSRGFSFMNDGPIDMRFDQSNGLSACELIESVDEKTLSDIIWKYGDERYSRRIAKEIILQRERHKIKNTHELVSIIDKAIPKNDKNKHNATRTFQALRIYINKELDVLRDALNSSYNILAPKGRLVLITYHSLEDRVIKDFLSLTDKNRSTPRDLPIKSEFLTKMFQLVKKSIKPTEKEINDNPRSRSAKLNILEKTNENYD